MDRRAEAAVRRSATFLALVSFGLVAFASCATRSISASAPASPCLSEVTYSCYEVRRFMPDKETQLSHVYRGACFALRSRNDVFLVTAAHVVRGPMPASILEIDGKRIRDAVALGHRVRVGRDSLTPVAICLGEPDVCVMAMLDTDSCAMGGRVFGLDSTDVRPGQVVTAWGFPGTGSAQPRDARVASVEKGYFVLNVPLAPGYSGGPVVSKEGKLLGMVSRTEEKQSRIVPISTIARIVSGFQRNSRPYVDGQLLAPGH